MAVASSSLKSHYDVIFCPSMLLHYYKLSVDGVGHVGVGVRESVFIIPCQIGGCVELMKGRAGSW